MVRTRRSNRPRSRPVGKARKTCTISTKTMTSSATPTVCSTALSDQYNVEASVTDPVNTISGPIRLAGRCHHAISPLTEYDNAIQRISAACTGAMSLAEMIASEPPRPTSSTTAMNHNRALGAVAAAGRPGSSGSSASFTTFPTEEAPFHLATQPAVPATRKPPLQMASSPPYHQGLLLPA